jgi:hypothetical protein
MNSTLFLEKTNNMTDKDIIRFGLTLDKDKPFVEVVLDRFAEMDNMLQRERQAYKAEIEKLRTENQNYKQAYFDQWYNNTEIEKCWAVLGGYNRKHLELHEAIREYIRNREWNYEENLHCNPDVPKVKHYKIYSPTRAEIIGVCTSDGLANAKNEEPRCEFIEITKAEFDTFYNQ